jgi:hypothetical protein
LQNAASEKTTIAPPLPLPNFQPVWQFTLTRLVAAHHQALPVTPKLGLHADSWPYEDRNGAMALH